MKLLMVLMAAGIAFGAIDEGEIKKCHEAIRSSVSNPTANPALAALSYDAELAKVAKAAIDTQPCGKDGKFMEHTTLAWRSQQAGCKRDQGECGENIMFKSTTASSWNNGQLNAKKLSEEACHDWEIEKHWYSYAKGDGDCNRVSDADIKKTCQDVYTKSDGFVEYRHYTQIVEQNTVAIGCAHRVCESSDSPKKQVSYVLCMYRKRGNYAGEKPYNRALSNTERSQARAASSGLSLAELCVAQTSSVTSLPDKISTPKGDVTPLKIVKHVCKNNLCNAVVQFVRANGKKGRLLKGGDSCGDLGLCPDCTVCA